MLTFIFYMYLKIINIGFVAVLWFVAVLEFVYDLVWISQNLVKVAF